MLSTRNERPILKNLLRREPARVEYEDANQDTKRESSRRTRAGKRDIRRGDLRRRDTKRRTYKREATTEA